MYWSGNLDNKRMGVEEDLHKMDRWPEKSSEKPTKMTINKIIATQMTMERSILGFLRNNLFIHLALFISLLGSLSKKFYSGLHCTNSGLLFLWDRWSIVVVVVQCLVVFPGFLFSDFYTPVVSWPGDLSGPLPF